MSTSMRCFTCTDHVGFWPVGVASVVFAPSEDRARELLVEELRKLGLDQATKPFTMVERKLAEAAYVLNAGDY